MEIRGQTALVTGAASGIGRELCVVLAERGAAKLLMLDIDEDGLAETARQAAALGAEALTRRCNLADLPDLAGAYAWAAGHDYRICFNNAGIVVGLPNYPDCSDERIDDVIRLDLTAVVIGTRYAIKHLASKGGGVIVNTGSTAAVVPLFDNIPYRVAKTGVHYLTECCAPLLESSNIRVNAFHPGGTITPILGKLGGPGGPRPDWATQQMQGIRMWQVREIVEAAMGLVEDDGRHAENLVLPNERIA